MKVIKKIGFFFYLVALFIWTCIEAILATAGLVLGLPFRMLAFVTFFIWLGIINGWNAAATLVNKGPGLLEGRMRTKNKGDE